MNMRAARQLKKLTQTKLSSITGISQATLSNIETGNLEATEQQKLILNAVLGDIDWRMTVNNSDLIVNEMNTLLHVMNMLMQKVGVQRTLNLFAGKTNSEIRKTMTLFMPEREEPLELPVFRGEK